MKWRLVLRRLQGCQRQETYPTMFKCPPSAGSGPPRNRETFHPVWSVIRSRMGTINPGMELITLEVFISTKALLQMKKMAYLCRSAGSVEGSDLRAFSTFAKASRCSSSACLVHSFCSPWGSSSKSSLYSALQSAA